MLNRECKPNKTMVVLQYDMNEKLIKEWESAKVAAAAMDVSLSLIRMCCRGEQKFCKGFIWRYKVETYNEVKLVNLPDFRPLYATDTGCILDLSGRPNRGSDHDGYLAICFERLSDGKCAVKLVHCLIALAFFGPADGRFVNHKNGMKTDNRVENLEYVTRQENIQHAFSTGLINRTTTYKGVIRIDLNTNNCYL